jgi:hypothetical protein
MIPMTNTTTTTQIDARITELAAVIAGQAEAIARGEMMLPRASITGAVRRLADNVDTLKAWTELRDEATD